MKAKSSQNKKLTLNSVIMKPTYMVHIIEIKLI